MTNARGMQTTFAPGTSRGPRNAATFALQMARDKQRQLEAAARIRALRGAKPQPVVAEEVGVRLRTYQHWEAGDGIAWENLQRLAKLYGVSENFILYGDEQPRGPESQLDELQQELGEVRMKIDELLAFALERALGDVPPPARRQAGGSAGDAGASAETG